MYLTLIILPLLGSISSALFGRKLGVTGAHIITISCLIFSSILTGLVYYEVVLNSSPVIINLGSWFTIGNMNVNWEFYFDELSVSMLIPVIWISTLIHIYSVDYMSGDPHNQRFFSYMSLFTFFMIILVTGNNYLIMFTGWEGIGISSYLLISYWFTRTQAVKSALMTLTMNRIGDMSISISMFIMLTVLNSLNYSTILSAGYTLDENIITLITLLLFIGAMAKSAQIPLHAWLPLSMEAATPISALIHAATLVTSGIYLMVRTSHLLEYSSTTLLVITIIGSLTLIISALSGLVQNDLKRIIAFSTISQLGYMFLAIGISNYNVALFHVINHAFFKAMLFLAAGAVIHSVNDQQDIRKLGGLIRFLPFIYSIIMIGTLSLMATPWLTGFYSKDLILELAYGTYSISGLYGYILGSLTAGLTAFYSFRLISMVFLTVPNANLKTYNNVHEANWIVIIPLTILAIFSIFYGYVCSDLYVGPGSDIFNNAIFIHPNNITIIEAEFSLPSYIKLLPSVFSISGALFAVYLYTKEYIFTIELTETVLGYNLYKFFNGKFYFEVIYNAFFVKTGLITGYAISKIFDRGIIELIGPFGITYSLLNGTRFISETDQNDLTNINNYTLYIIFAFVSLLLIALLPIIAILNITDYFIWAIIYTVALVISIN